MWISTDFTRQFLFLIFYFWFYRTNEDGKQWRPKQRNKCFIKQLKDSIFTDCELMMIFQLFFKHFLIHFWTKTIWLKFKLCYTICYLKKLRRGQILYIFWEIFSMDKSKINNKHIGASIFLYILYFKLENSFCFLYLNIEEKWNWKRSNVNLNWSEWFVFKFTNFFFLSNYYLFILKWFIIKVNH